MIWENCPYRNYPNVTRTTFASFYPGQNSWKMSRMILPKGKITDSSVNFYFWKLLWLNLTKCSLWGKWPMIQYESYYMTHIICFIILYYMTHIIWVIYLTNMGLFTLESYVWPGVGLHKSYGWHKFSPNPNVPYVNKFQFSLFYRNHDSLFMGYIEFEPNAIHSNWAKLYIPHPVTIVCKGRVSLSFLSPMELSLVNFLRV